MTNLRTQSDGVIRWTEIISRMRICSRRTKSARYRTYGAKQRRTPRHPTCFGSRRKSFGDSGYIPDLTSHQDNYAGSSIIKALGNSNLEVHVAHPHEPSSPIDSVTYHTQQSNKPLSPLLSSIKPDLVISTSAGGSYETQKSIIDSTIDASIPSFIASEFSHDSLNIKLHDRLPPSRERARVIEYLRAHASEGRISWVGIATGTTLDRGLLSGNLGFDVKWQSATLHGQGDEGFPASSSPWIGKVVTAVIQHWEDVKDQYIYASGMTVSANQVVAALEKETGKTFEVGRQDVEQCVREAERRFEQGYPDAGMFLMERSVLYDTSLDAAGAFERQDAKARLGLEGEKLESIIHGVLHDEKHHGGKPGCGCD